MEWTDLINVSLMLWVWALLLLQALVWVVAFAGVGAAAAAVLERPWRACASPPHLSSSVPAHPHHPPTSYHQLLAFLLHSSVWQLYNGLSDTMERRNNSHSKWLVAAPTHVKPELEESVTVTLDIQPSNKGCLSSWPSGTGQWLPSVHGICA